MKVKSFAEACKKLKYNSKTVLPDISGMPARHQKSMIATAKLMIIAEAINDGWVPNWDDSNEYKYYPWFYLNKPGFRFGGTNFDWTCTFTSGGSRLCFKTRALAEYAGKTFVSLYKEMMVIGE